MSLSPSLDDLFLRSAMLRDPRVQMLTPVAFRALMMLVSAEAATRVWTYTAPSTEGVPFDDARISRLLGLSIPAWSEVWGEISPFFTLTDNYIRVREDWIKLSPQIGTKRPAITADTRVEVIRKSEYRCGYCGKADGPFDVDHIIPVSQGGSNDPTNLIAACWPCNRSKGGRTPGEWLS